MADRTYADSARLDVGIDVGLLQADDPTELVGGDQTLVDEAVEGDRGDPDLLSGRRRTEPGNLVAVDGSIFIHNNMIADFHTF